MGYIITLIAYIMAYVFLIFVLRKIGRVKCLDLLFIAVTVVCYLVLAYLIYLDVGFSDWNFQNALPTANVSPFMFASLILYPFLPKGAKKIWGTLISLLSLGMFGALSLACVSRAVIHYKFHFKFLLDYMSHFALSLFGVYLVTSEQVILGKKKCLIGGVLIVGVALIMLVINAIAGTAFFGLALNEKYNVYNMVLVPNCYLSALLYFVGLCVVLLLGYFYLRLVTGKRGSSGLKQGRGNPQGDL